MPSKTPKMARTMAAAAHDPAFAKKIGAKYAIAVNSGTDALLLSLMALGVGAGDEVITPPFTFVATVETVALLGATPVFADIDPITFNLDPVKVAEKTRTALFGSRAAGVDRRHLRQMSSPHGVNVGVTAVIARLRERASA